MRIFVIYPSPLRPYNNQQFHAENLSISWLYHECLIMIVVSTTSLEHCTVIILYE